VLRPAIGAITLFVDDPKRAKAFYERVFTTSILFEDESSVALKFDHTILNLLARSEAGELIAPASVAPANAGSSFQFTVWVDDTDATCSELASRGVTLLNGPLDRPWGVRTACFADPDGHAWEIAQQLPPVAVP
jgi:catechol 2,3-dioxygenase-like lactoylglutathione lyase family enzyme